MVSEHDLKKALKEYLQSGPPDEITEQVERLEMELASPGEWEAAKYAANTEPNSESSSTIK